MLRTLSQQRTAPSVRCRSPAGIAHFVKGRQGTTTRRQARSLRLPTVPTAVPQRGAASPTPRARGLALCRVTTGGLKRSQLSHWFFDYDNDGFEDILWWLPLRNGRWRITGASTSGCQARLRNRGNGASPTSPPLWGSIVFARRWRQLNLDNDGWLDFTWRPATPTRHTDPQSRVPERRRCPISEVTSSGVSAVEGAWGGLCGSRHDGIRTSTR
jgi:hypothetical protein